MKIEDLLKMDMGAAIEWLIDNQYDFQLTPKKSVQQRAQYKALLQRCRDAICEAGYEDYDRGLMQEIDKAI